MENSQEFVEATNHEGFSDLPPIERVRFVGDAIIKVATGDINDNLDAAERLGLTTISELRQLRKIAKTHGDTLANDHEHKSNLSQEILDSTDDSAQSPEGGDMSTQIRKIDHVIDVLDSMPRTEPYDGLTAITLENESPTKQNPEQAETAENQEVSTEIVDQALASLGDKVQRNGRTKSRDLRVAIIKAIYSHGRDDNFSISKSEDQRSVATLVAQLIARDASEHKVVPAEVSQALQDLVDKDLVQTNRKKFATTASLSEATVQEIQNSSQEQGLDSKKN